MSAYKRLKLVNVFIALIICGLLMIFSSWINFRFENIDSDYTKINLAVTISQIVIYGIPILIYYTFNDYLEKKYFDLKEPHKKSKISTVNLKNILLILIISVLTVIMMYFFRNFVFNLVYGISHAAPVGFLEEYNDFNATDLSVQQFIISLISLVIVTSIMEEMFYRGILVKSYDYLPAVLVIGISTISFAFAHHSLMQIVLVVPFGFVSALILLKTNNIIFSIIVHASANIVALGNVRIDKMFFSVDYPINYNEPMIALTNSFFCFTVLVAVIVMTLLCINIIAASGIEKETLEKENRIKKNKKSSLLEWITYGTACFIFCLILIKVNMVH